MRRKKARCTSATSPASCSPFRPVFREHFAELERRSDNKEKTKAEITQIHRRLRSPLRPGTASNADLHQGRRGCRGGCAEALGTSLSGRRCSALALWPAPGFLRHASCASCGPGVSSMAVWSAQAFPRYLKPRGDSTPKSEAKIRELHAIDLRWAGQDREERQAYHRRALGFGGWIRASLLDSLAALGTRGIMG